ncbi:hypothetical protein ARMGADRAFT_1023942 [Armillaria gallica]|uniref:Uncharacterized protein n=1 Tax=Armillaria gallica TaxID=47427 RepID=A0A2H3EJ15_ARMGA|nr:hypothetical protein ARMGADRAFT_1023942 [Armillaria gallica]
MVSNGPVWTSGASMWETTTNRSVSIHALKLKLEILATYSTWETGATLLATSENTEETHTHWIKGKHTSGLNIFLARTSEELKESETFWVIICFTTDDDNFELML